MMNAAEYRHHHRLARVLPIQIVGIDALDQEGEQTAGEANEGRGQHKGAELVALRVIAEAGHTLLIVADRLQHPAERCVDYPPQKVQGSDDHGTRKEMIDQRAFKTRPYYPLEPVLAAGERGPFKGDFVKQLREGEGQQREINSAPAQDQDRK